MNDRNVFECKLCGVCCQGEGGIFLTIEQAEGPARLLHLSLEEFVERFTEPRHGLLSLLTDAEGYCLMHDKETHYCRIHPAKPRMCRDWPYFHGMLDNLEGFEAARNNCPGILPEVSWEEFKAWHGKHVGRKPPRTYITVCAGDDPEDE